MKEEMMTTGFTGGDTATGPTAGFDPKMKLRAKLKDLKGLVAPGNTLSTSNKKKVKSEDYNYEATDYHRGQGEKIQKRTKKWMDKKGLKGAPGLDAIKARTAEHKAKRNVEEASAVLDANKKIANKEKRKKQEAELRSLLNHAIDLKKGRPESAEPEGEELKQYSPNVTYQANGGRKSGKLGKSSVYSLKDKGESKKEFRKSQVKDIKGGYLKKEDWKPEIEHSKLGDAVKKKREKKRKEAEDSLPPHLKLDTMKKAFAHTNEAIAPSPQEIQVHKKISMLQQKLAQLRKKTVNQAAKAGSAAKTADAEVTTENYAYVAEKRKTKINLKPTTKDQKGEGKFINRYNPRYLPYVEENDPLRPSHAAPNKLFQYKVNLPEVGETIVYANSPAELMIKLRLLVNPRLRGGIKIDRILPYDAYKFYTDKRAKALRRK